MAQQADLDWERTPVTDLSGGLNTSKQPENIDPKECIDCMNVDYMQGMLRVDTGYSLFGQAVLGIPQGCFQVFKTNGSSELMLATTQSFYRWNTAFSEWDFVTDPNSHLTTAAQVAGDTTITVNSVAGWAANDWIGITLGDGSQLRTFIVSISSLVVTLNDPIPEGKTVGNGATVMHAPNLSGEIDEQVQFQTFPANNWLIFTNGIDNVKYYNLGILQDLPGLPTNTSCRSINVFHEMLCLADTTEGGTRHPQRIRRSDAGDPTNWSTGISGIDELLDTEDFILSLNILGPWLIVYRETSIIRGSYLGNLNQTMFYEYMIQGEGALSKGAVAEIGGAHVFVGNADVYKYYGGYDLESAGDNIFYRTLAITGNLNPSYKSQTFAFFVGELDEVWIFYACGSCSTPGTMLRLVLESNSWFVRKFANAMSGFGFYINTVNRVWSSLLGSWSFQTYTWDSKVQLANAPATLLCDAENPQVYTYDYFSIGDNIYYIPWNYTTKDFGAKDSLIRFNRIIMQGRGNGILVSFSPDQGKTWEEIGSVDFGSTFTRQSVYYNVTSEYARFRFSGTDPNSAISWYEIEWKQETNQ